MQRANFDTRIKIQDLIRSQLPEFIADENPKFVEFLNQYYISQEHQGGPVDIAENLDQYIKLDNLTTEVIVGEVTLTTSITSQSTTINVSSTKSFPKKYGLLKIDNEIITYLDSDETSFIGCIRGFSGITDYHQEINKEELVFEKSSASAHTVNSSVKNLSSLFLKEFYKKLKFSLAPGLEDLDFSVELNVSNFIKEARSLYESKGTYESFRILFNILYNETPSIINLEDFLIKPSDASYKKRSSVTVIPISGDISLLEGQTILKNLDDLTTASVSEIDTFTKNGVKYYRLNLFVGYDDTYPSITGNFNITTNSRVSETVVVSNTDLVAITVDSTVGFEESGSIFKGNTEIFYTEKTVNQFLGCHINGDFPVTVNKTDFIYGTNTYYGYEEGDTSRRVDFIITGILSDFDLKNDDFNFEIGDSLYPESIGQIVTKGISKKEIFANSLVYNTNSRYQINFYSGNTIRISSNVLETPLKVGDYVEILSRGTEFAIPGYEHVNIQSISSDGSISLSVSTSNLNRNLTYDARRLLNKATSEYVPVKYGNDVISSDIQNVYFDDEDGSDIAYIASNSLPSYPIDIKPFEYKIKKFGGFDGIKREYSTIVFDTPISFLTGDKVFYYPDPSLTITNLEEGFYFVEVLEDKKSLKLYQSGVNVPSEDFLYFGLSLGDTLPENENRLVLFDQREGLLYPQKVLNKINLSQTIDSSLPTEVEPGPIGILKNGVEIYSYKTNDKVYYGPIESVDVLNGGSNYDVSNPPLIEPAYGSAEFYPVVSGSVNKILIDQSFFDFDNITSIEFNGGNGSGAKFRPVVEKVERNLDFDTRLVSDGGGIDKKERTITFKNAHGLINGQEIVYNSNGLSEVNIKTRILDSTTTPSFRNQYIFDAVSLDQFGGSVAIDSDKVVIGAPLAEIFVGATLYAGAGKAYITDLNGSEYILLSAPEADLQTNAQFGSAVAIGQGVIAVTAVFESTSRGAVYLFDYEGNFKSKITAFDAADGDQFGFSIAIGNDRIVVGSRYDDDYGLQTGAAYIYDLEGNIINKIYPSDPEATLVFGFSVDINDNLIAVGAVGYADFIGAIYLYDVNGNFIRRIVPSDGSGGGVTIGDRFGTSISIKEDLIAVGAPYRDGEKGAIYLFDYEGNELNILTDSAGVAQDYMGRNVKINSGRIVTSSFGYNSFAGKVFVYDITGNLLSTLIPTDSTASDQFGFALAIGSGRIIVGAREPGVRTGKVYHYGTPVNAFEFKKLVNNAIYYPRILDRSKIELYDSLNNYYQQLNPVGFTTVTDLGTHKFLSSGRNKLSEILVVSGGSNYTNRRLKVSSSGISTFSNTINYKNHGFSDGDIVNYESEITSISGISTSDKYRVLKVDDDTFGLAYAGEDGKDITDYSRRYRARLFDSGSGDQIFSDPEFSVNIRYSSPGIGNTQTVLKGFPIIRGEISQIYVYDGGSDYGSNSLNFNNRPPILVKNGSGAILDPVIVDGKISSVKVLFGGSNYYSIPDLVVNGSGIGAVLRATLSDNKIVSVSVLNSGSGYAQADTTVTILNPGAGTVLRANIRSLTPNISFRYGIQNNFYRDPSSELLIRGRNNLQYAVVSYSDTLKNKLNDVSGTNGSHSEIIGWAYDGNPIYGSYGYSDPEDINSDIKLLNSGYELTTIDNRPSEDIFPLGYFVEDYVYSVDSDLDEFNGRFGKTIDFPNGVYAYFATTELNVDEGIIGKFPYFIGNKFKSKYLKINQNLNQSFDFNSSKLLRNTYPYGIGDKFSTNDFISESNKLTYQESIIESISTGGIDGMTIIEPGDNYSVNDTVVFEDVEDLRNKPFVKVSEISGKEVSSIDTELISYPNSVLSWEDKNYIRVNVFPYHEYNVDDIITISGLSTDSLKINDTYKVKFDTINSTLFESIGDYSTTGIVTDIYLSYIPENVSVGNSIRIDDELFKILDFYNTFSIAKVERSVSGTAHTSGANIEFLPDYFTIEKSVDKFISNKSRNLYFNPNIALSVGVNTGFGVTVSYNIGNSNYNTFIPSQSILLQNNKLNTADKIILSKESSSLPISVKSPETNAEFNIPDDVNEFYVVKKSIDFIGIVTNVGLTTFSNGLFFLDGGSNDYGYQFTTVEDQITADSNRITTTVSISTSHNLQVGDKVKLNVRPDLNVGIGTSTSIRVKYKDGNLLINEIKFTSSEVNNIDNILSIYQHNFHTGQKIFYDSEDNVISGLSTGEYFVYKIDDDNIKLSETYLESISTPPTVVSFGSVGGNLQIISSINPPISNYRNNNLVFDLSDTSLSGYGFNVYTDDGYENVFNAIKDDGLFAVSGIGTVGVSTDAALILDYTDKTPAILYYNLTESGIPVSTTDKDVKQYSQITYKSSIYNGEFPIIGITDQSFDICIPRIPERLSYNSSDCDRLEYSTTSLSARGPIKKLFVVNQGYPLKNLPSFLSVSSSLGKGAFLVPTSKSIGKILSSRITNEGFDYSSDNTIRPVASVPKSLYLTNTNKINSVSVLNGGSDYSFAPILIIVDPQNGEVINSGFLDPIMSGSSISSVDINISPAGLPDGEVLIRSINNSNGVNIDRVEYSPSGTVTCTITTPIAGFSSPLFELGEKIYVEGIEKQSSDGTGFNSENYGYNFFTVSQYFDTNPVKVEFNISNYSNNPGTPKQVQEGSASIIKYDNYPRFSIDKSLSSFFEGENLLINRGNGFENSGLKVTKANTSNIRVLGNFTPKIGDILKGENTSSVGTVSYIKSSDAVYNSSWTIVKDLGWTFNTGKLSESFQVFSDNDYYQKMSYSVKSTKTWDEISSVINPLVHISGLKDFADVQITGKADSGISTESKTEFELKNSFFSELRVDRINDFDLAIDVNVTKNGSSDVSRSVKLNNTYLLDFVLCKSNRVLDIDDISDDFSSKNDKRKENETIISINSSNYYNKFLILSKDIISGKIQFNEIISLNDDESVYSLFKTQISNGENILESIIPSYDVNFNYILDAFPVDPDNSAISFKILKETFINDFVGSNSNELGCISLLSSNVEAESGISTSVYNLDTNDYSAVHSSIQILNDDKSKMNYVEIYVSHDGNDTFINQYYFDSEDGFSFSSLGQFEPSLDGGELSLNYTSNTEENLTIRSRSVAFGSTSLGIGTYRFLSENQPDGSERTALYQSQFDTITSGTGEVFSIDSNLFSAVKSTVKVSTGQTSSVHQVISLFDGSDVYVSEYPFLSARSEVGVGTFIGDFSLGQFKLSFKPYSYPDDVEIISFNQCFYKDYDEINQPLDLNYSPVNESLSLANYYGNNVDLGYKVDFEMNYKGSPIFAKSFDPSNTSVVDFSTNSFNIKDHLFNTGEELKYTPGSTFVGIGSSPIGIVETEDNVGVLTDLLPSTLYAIRDDNDTFRVATRKEYATAGYGVTFTSVGIGNYHQIEMVKKNEKSLISINNLVQSPISYTYISHVLANNSGQISAGATTFALSGISSIRPKDVLRIEDEYAIVENVGYGTESVGPITFSGNEPLVEVSRGSFGSKALSHLDGTNCQIYRGAYNINGNKIYFIDPPKGNNLDLVRASESNLSIDRDSFNGRVFLRKSYESNEVYDDISDQFTGIGQTFTLTAQGINTVGLGTSGGNGLVFINGVFQSPTTENNSDNNYIIEEDLNLGISSITFTGITFEENDFLSEIDINQNKLPRGGVIVSYGSTAGLGFAPLVGASVTAVLNSGSIISVGEQPSDEIGSGYYEIPSVEIIDPDHNGDDAIINAIVGAGGTLAFDVVFGGTGYVNPFINVGSPSYSNLSIIGVSRLSEGPTTDSGFGALITLDVGPSDSVGIGSTLYEVKGFNIVRNGYGFRRGDVFKPIGLVTDRNLSAPIYDFEITVVDTFSDEFSAIQIGELDYIDSLAPYQDGKRVRFPLIYRGENLTFETDELDEESELIDLNNVLVIFINGVLQEPIKSYQFNGGSTFTFTFPPKESDDVKVFFYRGTRGEDSLQFDIDETIQIGDTVQIVLNNEIENTKTQDERIVYSITSSDVFQTNIYQYVGIDDQNYKPLHWTKQKSDLILNNEELSKARRLKSSQVYPTANIISNFDANSTEIYVDDISLFDYEDETIINFDALVFTNAVGVGTTIPSKNYELISGVNNLEGFNASVTSISPTSGIGAADGIEFVISRDPFTFTNFTVGTVFYITETNVGQGVISLDNSGSNTLSISTSFVNNIYQVASFNSSTGTIVCNVDSGSNLSGITTSGTLNYPVGKLSWGRLSGFQRRSVDPLDIDIMGYTSSVGMTSDSYNSGLSTYPIIQRRNFGFRDSGALIV
jgi:hypothetical protein